MAVPIRKRVVGWTNRSEQLFVFQELYSDDPIQQKHALDRIAVWKCRALHKLSTAIHCTWQIVAAKLQDVEAHQTGTNRQQAEQIRMAYAIALLRFINLITEAGQTRSHVRSVHVIAEELGVPEWIVDLRHDAAHSSMPSLTLLRSAADFAMGWLKTEYWEPQLAETSRDSSSHSQTGGDTYREVALSSRKDAAIAERDMEKVLLNYMDVMYTLTQRDKEGQKTKEDNKALKQILGQIESMFSKLKKEDALQILVQDGFLCSTQQQLKSLGIQATDLQTADLVLPPAYIKFWRPLLKAIHSLKMTPLLLQVLLSELGQLRSLRNQLLAGWAATILNAIDLADQELYKKGHPYQLYGSSFSIPERKLLQICAQKPSELSAQLVLQLVVLCSHLSSVKKERLSKLCNIYTGASVSGKEHLPHNVQDLPMLLRAHKRKHNDVRESEKSSPLVERNTVWNLYEGDIDWSQIALGGYLDIDGDQNTSLELPELVNTLVKTSVAGQDLFPVAEQLDVLCDGATEALDIQGTSDPTSCEHWSAEDVLTLEEHVMLF